MIGKVNVAAIIRSCTINTENIKKCTVMKERLIRPITSERIPLMHFSVVC